ncbi:MAG: PfkB family carbohydrate kinase [Spirochaetia bacterium]
MSDTDVVVVGGINADVTGRSAEELVPGTSNPGTISITPGGAGRNIAEVLARLGVRSRLVGTIGDDEFGRAVLARSVEAGVDVAGVATIEENTGVYLTVVDEDGTMHVSISDMPGAARTDAAFVSAALAAITSAAAVVVDTNVPTEAITATLQWAAAHGVKSIVQVVSVPKVRRLVGVDARADWIIMNVDEYVAFAAACRDRSVVHADNALVTRGAQGVDRVSLSTGESVTYPAFVARVTDENGAGDAFTAGFCAGITAGDGIEAAVRMGAATAALTVESVGTVPSDLTLAAVQQFPRGRGS